MLLSSDAVGEYDSCASFYSPAHLPAIVEQSLEQALRGMQKINGVVGLRCANEVKCII